MEEFLVPTTEKIDVNTLPYVSFFNNMAEKKEEMQAQIPGVQPPNPVLFNKGEYSLQIPLKFHLVEAKRLWVERQDGKEPISVSLTDPGFKTPYIEEIHAAILVYTPQGLVPATCTFKRALAKGAVQAVNDLAGMNDPDYLSRWMARSAEHKAAASIRVPFGRFTVLMTTKQDVAKSTGRLFPISSGKLSPTTAADLNALNAFSADEANVAKLKAVTAFNRKRIDDLLALV
jgi:hypothetical protein